MKRIESNGTVGPWAKATDEDKEAIDAAARELERLNPNPRALKCDLLNGEWELLYTTSASILGATRPW